MHDGVLYLVLWLVAIPATVAVNTLMLISVCVCYSRPVPIYCVALGSIVQAVESSGIRLAELWCTNYLPRRLCGEESQTSDVRRTT